VRVAFVQHWYLLEEVRSTSRYQKAPQPPARNRGNLHARDKPHQFSNLAGNVDIHMALEMGDG